MNTAIYLIRHAAYENPKRIFHGRLPGFPLSADGHAQAKRLAKTMAYLPINALYASPLPRAYQTAQAVAKVHSLDVQIDERLLDLKTPLQGKPISYMESIDWNFYRPEFLALGGETLSDVFRRMNSCIREKMQIHEGKHIVFVSHGDPIMAIKIKYLGGHLRSRKPMYPYVPVASGYIIRMNYNGSILSISDFPESGGK